MKASIKIDYENNAEIFWDHLNTYDVIHDAWISDEAKVAASQLAGYGHSQQDEVILDKTVAAELLDWFATLPGWEDGPDFAQNPVIWGECSPVDAE